MYKLVTKSSALLALLALLNYTPVQAGGEHAAPDTVQSNETGKGPQGGRLLAEADFALEVTIFETGVPPEMRLYAYADGQAIPPNALDAKVTLSRLDGQQDQIRFAPEQQYLVGDISISEPHSYSVDVDVSYRGKSYHWHYDSFEGRVEMSDRIIALSNIGTDIAAQHTLQQKTHLFGVVSAPPTAHFNVRAPYAGKLTQVLVQQGDTVTTGQLLARVSNAATLKLYDIVSPANGIITDRFFNNNELIRDEVLLSILDYSKVYVELSAFPNDIEQLRVDMPVTVFSLHGGKSASSNISYIAPQMTEGHIARVRAVLDNRTGYWRPGMHIKAEVVTAEIPVALAVKKSAIQRFRDMPVVFARYGNTFEVRMLQFGHQDDDYIEVTSGLKPGTQYATDNSFVLKADVLKSGASHDH
jgi:membrane fusion protein, heavy metal efflux system